MPDRLADAADTLRRLRSLLRGLVDDYEDTYIAGLIDRLGRQLETMDCAIRSTAAETYRANVEFSCDEDMSIREALADADRRTAQWRRRIGIREAA